MNFQRNKTENGSWAYDYVKVGGWDSGNLTMLKDIIQWPSPPGKTPPHREVESICSKPCEKGKVKVRSWKNEVMSMREFLVTLHSYLVT